MTLVEVERKGRRDIGPVLLAPTSPLLELVASDGIS